MSRSDVRERARVAAMTLASRVDLERRVVDDDEDDDRDMRARVASRTEDEDDATLREISRATLETLRAMQEAQVRMNGKLAWISRSLPKIYDAVANDVTTAIEEQGTRISELAKTVSEVRLGSVMRSSANARARESANGEVEVEATRGEGESARATATPSRSASPGPNGSTLPSTSLKYDEFVNEENADVVAKLPRLGRVGGEETPAPSGGAAVKYNKKGSASKGAVKMEDPRKWTRAKWFEHLRAVTPRLFATLDDVSIGDMLDASKCYFVQRGARVVRQGERGSSMFVIVLGKMHVVVTDETKNRGEPLQVSTMQQGDFFGEIALMTGDERRATVMAPYEGDGNVWVLEFSKTNIGSVILARPNVMRVLTDVCADRRLSKF